MKILWLITYVIHGTPDFTFGWGVLLGVCILLDLVLSE